MGFGKPVNKKKMKEKGGGGGGTFIRFIKNDELNVRFLGDPEDTEHWTEVMWVYDPALGENGGGYPNPEPGMAGHWPKGKNPPGGNVSKKYIAAVVDVDEKEVVPVLIPVSLGNQLVAFEGRRGSLTARDIALYKEGSGKDGTSYGMAPEDKSKMNLTKFKGTLDLEEVLQAAYDHYFGEDAEDEEDDEEYDEEDEDDERPRARRKPAKKAVKKTVKRTVKSSPAKKRKPSPAAKKSSTKKVARRRLGG